MSDSEAYVELIEAAIAREMDVLGDGRALACARSVEGLTVADDGTVASLEGSGPAVLAALVEAYVAESGDVAAFLIAQRIENRREGDLPLPDSLERHL